MNSILFILLMGPSPDQGGNAFMSLLPLVLILAVMYLFFIRPQMKKQKDQRKFREALKKGDKIITIGGIHGKILEVQETTLIIETEGLGRLKIEKSAAALDASSLLTEQK